MISSEPGRLLNTIRSRCRKIQFGGLCEEDLKQAVHSALQAARAEPIDDTTFNTLSHLANGSVRRLLSLHALKGAELASSVQTILTRLPQVDWARVHKVSDDLAPIAAAERFEVFFDILLGALHEAVRDAAGSPAQSASGKVSAGQAKLSEQIRSTGQLQTWAE
ncbi:MAG: AAA family ATPase, partial [Pseudomonadota bacterium]